jgi:hypothetical protein
VTALDVVLQNLLSFRILVQASEENGIYIRKAVTWFRQIFVGLSPRRPGFAARFVLDSVTLR